jgi:alpha-1,3-rhamnosyl/mannosyltransferase
VKVILAVDPIRRPLTGIGKYTWELASKLRNLEQIEEIKYIAHGQWRNFDSLQKSITAQYHAGTNNINFRTLMRRKVFRSGLVRWSYDQVATALAKTKFQASDGYLVHGPNYLVPKSSLPTVITVHDLSTFINPSWHPSVRRNHINKKLPECINRARLILTDTHTVKTELQKFFNLPEEKVVAVPLGVDPVFHPRKMVSIATTLTKYGLKPNTYSLCVATIEPRKNIQRLIRAYSRLPVSLLQKWPLVLIGEPGWNSQAIHQEIAQAQQKGWLRYIGFVPDKELPEIYAGARLFVYPSLYEGFGLPVLEAMASGIPTLTSNRSCLPEVAGNSSWLVNPEDEDELQQAMYSCLLDEIWQKESKNRGLARAAELTWENCVNNTAAAYQMALS